MNIKIFLAVFSIILILSIFSNDSSKLIWALGISIIFTALYLLTTYK